MDAFRSDGHLTDEILTALAGGEELEELTRLEAAEHLSFCDLCLDRYTEKLTGAELMTPARSCREGIWSRIRSRTLRLVTSRYATAAAAVALALTMLWGGTLFSDRAVVPGNRGEVLETLQEAVTSWARWPQTLTDAFSNFADFFDHRGADAPATQGGGYS